MKPIIWLLGLLALAMVSTVTLVWSGAYDVAAGEPHWPLTAYVLKAVRERSIAMRASGIVVPDLDDGSLIRNGAGNYDAMCAGCHLWPGVERTELSDGLNPAPPNLSRHRIVNPAAAFWAVKHGIKMAGMPAWGKSMDDESIWGMVAFFQRLPDMSEVRYRELVESSAGHTHGPASSETHDGNEDAPTHVHADGSAHEHTN